MLHQLLLGRRHAGPQHDKGSDCLAPFGVRKAKHGDLANGELATYHGFVMQEEPTVVRNGPSSQLVGPITTPSDSDFFINEINNQTVNSFNGVVATSTDKVHSLTVSAANAPPAAAPRKSNANPAGIDGSGGRGTKRK